MRTQRLALATAIAIMCGAGAAQAHQFQCTKTANDQSVFNITTFPTDVTWTLTLTNTAGDVSTALALEDDLLANYGFVFDPPAPLDVPVGGSVTWTFTQHFLTLEQCQAEANQDGLQDNRIDNLFRVVWDIGEAECQAEVTCPRPPPPPPGGATRTMGFFKTHEGALQQCLDQGAIDLGPGFNLIDTLAEALGLLWASPSKFDDGTTRTGLDKARFILARQTLVGICNERLFGSVPTPPNLISEALGALAGTSCTDILGLASQVDTFNNSGDTIGFPSGFVPGPATPGDAAQLASGNDPSIQTGAACP